MRRIMFVAVVLLGAMVIFAWSGASPGTGGAAAVVAPDSFESDDSSSTARLLAAETVHTFHTPTDSDWARLTATSAGQAWVIETTPLSGDALNTVVTVYRSTAVGLVAVDGNDDHEVFPDTLASGLLFRAPSPGTYFVRVSQAFAGAAGTYRLSIAPGVARRIGGSDRYRAAAEVSRLVWSGAGTRGWGAVTGPDVIVVAGGADPSGALAGSVLGASNDSVLLLAQPSGLPAATRAEVARLASSRVGTGKPVTVYVVGTTSSVGSSAEAALRAVPGVGSVIRLGGSSPAATASRVASELKATAGLGSTAIIVNSAAWADAISAAPVAATAGAPILFTAADRLPTATVSSLAALGIRRVVIVGGTASVSAAVESRLAQLTGSSPVRLGGADRYQVALAVARHGVAAYGMDGRTSVLASGEVFADALSAAPIGWWTGGPVLLTRGTGLSPSVIAFIDEQDARVLPSYAVGGPSTITAATMGAYADRY